MKVNREERSELGRSRRGELVEKAEFELGQNAQSWAKRVSEIWVC